MNVIPYTHFWSSKCREGRENNYFNFLPSYFAGHRPWKTAKEQERDLEDTLNGGRIAQALGVGGRGGSRDRAVNWAMTSAPAHHRSMESIGEELACPLPFARTVRQR